VPALTPKRWRLIQNEPASAATPEEAHSMSREDRQHELYKLLQSKRLPISTSAIAEALHISPSTAQRAIAGLEARGATIERIAGKGVRLVDDGAVEFFGQLFSPDELFALVTAHDLLARGDPALLEPLLKPLRDKIDRILRSAHSGYGELQRRVRIIRVAGRGTGACFQHISRALVDRKQLEFHYRGRERRTDSHRKVSPQRLVHYRDNWYLDAWCHDTRKIKTFAVERVHEARVSRLPAREVTDAELDRIFRGGYGIFSGAPVGIAELIFTAERAEWVASEKWHSEQRGEHLEDGRYRLRVPYSDIRELTMDILKYGAEVEVVAPEALRQHVAEQLRKALETYQSP
jgi:predicted DNA-binding transcriptional regulator YafY